MREINKPRCVLYDDGRHFEKLNSRVPQLFCHGERGGSGGFWYNYLRAEMLSMEYGHLALLLKVYLIGRGIKLKTVNFRY